MDRGSPEYMRLCFSYDPSTGAIAWAERPRGHFANEAAYKTYLRRWLGKQAGCLDESTGYLVIGLHNKLIYAHRLAWALQFGSWPEEAIDHIDGNKTNTKLVNLRSVSQAENSRNMRMKRSNSSGHQGVSFDHRCGKWRARIMVNYREKSCGYYGTKGEAIAAVRRASLENGFHENHGRTAEHEIPLGDDPGNSSCMDRR